jgi:hypothetical protein
MRLVTGFMPPENTNCANTVTTNNGMICSFGRATADNASPRMADANAGRGDVNEQLDARAL